MADVDYEAEQSTNLLQKRITIAENAKEQKYQGGIDIHNHEPASVTGVYGEQIHGCWADLEFYILIWLAAIAEGGKLMIKYVISQFLKYDLVLSRSQSSIITGATSFAWVLKPLVGFLSDTFYLFGSRRKVFVFIFALMTFLPLLCMATIVDATFSAVFALFFVQFGGVACVTIIESVMVERGLYGLVLDDPSQQPQHPLQPQQPQPIEPQVLLRSQRTIKIYMTQIFAFFWTFALISGMLFSYFNPDLANNLSYRNLFFICALFPFSIIISSLFLKETNSPYVGADLQHVDERQNLKKFWNGICDKRTWGPMLFMFLISLPPNIDESMIAFRTDNLHFSNSFGLLVTLLGGIGGILGVLLYNIWFSKYSYRKLLLGAFFVLISTNLLCLILIQHTNRTLGISDKAFAIFIEMLRSAATQMTRFPFLVYAAEVCPPNVEATMYACFMFCTDLGGCLSHLFGDLISTALHLSTENFSNLWTFSLISTSSYIIFLPLLFLLVPENAESFTHNSLISKE